MKPFLKSVLAKRAAVLGLAIGLAATGLAAAQQPKFSSDMQKGGWTYIALSDDVLVYMKDADPLMKDGKQQVWTAYDSQKPLKRETFTFLSVASLGDYDCKARKSRTIKETFYAMAGLKGKTWEAPKFEPTEFAGAAPGSVGELRLDYACRKRPVA